MTQNIDQTNRINGNGKKVWVIINPISGTKKFSNQDELKEKIEKEGMSPHFISIKEVDEKKFTEENLKDLHAVIVVGGDGTVRTIASLLVGKKTPLAIIPAGTFNHLAKDIKIPEELDACLKVIRQGKRQEIDVAEVNGYYFINNSSIGLYPRAVKRRRLYAPFVKWLAMTMSLLHIFKKFPLIKINYRFKDQQFEVITPMAFISNNLYYLDLLRLTERKKLDGGKLFLYINNCRTRLSFLKLILNVVFHKRKKMAGLFDIQGVDNCVLNVNKPAIDVAMDGEVFSLKAPLSYKIHPKQLTIISP